ALSQKETLENRYTQANAQFSQQSYGAAAVLFGQIANQARSLRERARALFRQGRSYELKGDWRPAVTSFTMAYLAEPSREWGGAGASPRPAPRMAAGQRSERGDPLLHARRPPGVERDDVPGRPLHGRLRCGPRPCRPCPHLARPPPPSQRRRPPGTRLLARPA